MESFVAHFGVILFIVIAALVVLGLFYISMKMLRELSKQQKMLDKQPQRELHPKLKEKLKK